MSVLMEEVTLSNIQSNKVDNSTSGKKILSRCPYLCGKIYSNEQNLKFHISLHENAGIENFEMKNYQISVVPTIINSKPNKCTVPNVKYKCEYENCNKNFIYISRLNRHQRKHNGSKPYKCEKCGRQFSENGNLKNHLRIHTLEKPFKCDVENCTSAFKTQSCLMSHLNSHINLKPFKCVQCTKTFSRKFSLIKHVKVHLNKRNHLCIICEKSYKYKNNLKNHMNSKHIVIKKMNLFFESEIITVNNNLLNDPNFDFLQNNYETISDSD